MSAATIEIPTWLEWVDQHPDMDKSHRHAVWLQMVKARDQALAEAAYTKVQHLPDIGLLLSLVTFVDRHHESDSGSCRPRVPEDCAPYCRACDALREVADDVLAAVRARSKANEL